MHRGMLPVSILFLALAVLVGSAVPVFAGELSLAQVQAQPGQTVTLPMTYQAGRTAAAGVASDIRFDPTVLRNPRCTAGPALAGTGKDVHCAEPHRGILRMGIFGLNLAAVPSGEVAQLTFDVAPTARARTYRLHQKPSAANAQGRQLGVKHTNGAVQVVANQ